MDKDTTMISETLVNLVSNLLKEQRTEILDSDKITEKIKNTLDADIRYEMDVYIKDAVKQIVKDHCESKSDLLKDTISKALDIALSDFLPMIIYEELSNDIHTNLKDRIEHRRDQVFAEMNSRINDDINRLKEDNYRNQRDINQLNNDNYRMQNNINNIMYNQHN